MQYIPYPSNTLSGFEMAKKTFPCGHKGKGKYCHRCEQEKQLVESKVKEQKIADEWERLFEADPVNLKPLNKKIS